MSPAKPGEDPEVMPEGLKDAVIRMKAAVDLWTTRLEELKSVPPDARPEPDERAATLLEEFSDDHGRAQEQMASWRAAAPGEWRVVGEDLESAWAEAHLTWQQVRNLHERQPGGTRGAHG